MKCIYLPTYNKGYSIACPYPQRKGNDNFLIGIRNTFFILKIPFQNWKDWNNPSYPFYKVTLDVCDFSPTDTIPDTTDFTEFCTAVLLSSISAFVDTTCLTKSRTVKSLDKSDLTDSCTVTLSKSVVVKSDCTVASSATWDGKEPTVTSS
mmetsp:Transcript_1617/g.1968  ORF Transcript_1617/g.1968 Transcript_1617/m.1968 type:complete len:150 (-) Transcript_1617:2013-2462(-)